MFLKFNLFNVSLVAIKQCGPGYKSPLDAYENGKPEKILYTICIQPNPKITNGSDYLAVIDVDPDSPTYSKVIFIVLPKLFVIECYSYYFMDIFNSFTYR